MPDEPPFESYTLPDLHDIARHIDARRFPERAARVQLLIEQKERRIEQLSALPWVEQAAAFGSGAPPLPLRVKAALGTELSFEEDCLHIRASWLAFGPGTRASGAMPYSSIRRVHIKIGGDSRPFLLVHDEDREEYAIGRGPLWITLWSR